MDKFLTKHYKHPNEEKVKTSKQVTLQNLKGVVNIDEVLDIKEKLKNLNLPENDVLMYLKKLSKKIPPRSVLKFTKIVKSLKPWTKNQSNKKISELALAILKQWQDFYTEKDNLDMIEVKCDVQTEKIRKSSKRHLCVLLKNIDKQKRHGLISSLDKEVFYRTKILYKYSFFMRRAQAIIKNNETVRRDLLDENITVKNFVDDLLNNKLK